MVMRLFSLKSHPMNPSIFRQKNHLTQKELGMAVEFPDSCANVRIAQYESNIRTPKENLMKLFASTLGVPVELFTVPVLSEPREYEAAEYWRYELGSRVLD
jgi:transcriptional regulator with XRE-family HTH domain